MTPFERIWQAWAGTDRASDLNRAVEMLAAEGVSKAVLDDALGKLIDVARANGISEADEESILSVGDRLHGWCHERFKIDTKVQPQTSVAPIVAVESVQDAIRPTPIS